MPCTFKALEFACNGNGYLALESLAATAYPCPNCNTIAYLEKSFRASRDRQRETAACVCCGPGFVLRRDLVDGGKNGESL
ncbi:hypothetical protein V1281_000113 [Nitrobacteraceae bacterium AZCC 2161]